MGEGETYSSCRESSAGETEAQGQEAAFPARTGESGGAGSHFGVPSNTPPSAPLFGAPPLFLWWRCFHGNIKPQDSQAVQGECWECWALDRKDPAEDSGSVHRGALRSVGLIHQRGFSSLLRGFPGGSAGRESACNAETWVQSLGWELQYSGLENSMDSCTVRGVAKSQARLSDFHFHFTFLCFQQKITAMRSRWLLSTRNWSLLFILLLRARSSFSHAKPHWGLSPPTTHPAQTFPQPASPCPSGLREALQLSGGTLPCWISCKSWCCTLMSMSPVTHEFWESREFDDLVQCCVPST